MSRHEFSTGFQPSAGQKSGFLSARKAGTLPADWSAHHDKRLRETNGRYGKIAKLSDEWGIATGALIARWHLLRAGASERGKPRTTSRGSVQSLTFNNMRMQVTQRMRDVLRWMEPGREINSLELAAKVGMTSERLRQTIDRNEGRLAAAGWHVWRRSIGRGGLMFKLETLS